MCHFWPSYVPFQRVILCKNGQKLLKINISCTFLPNNVCIFKNYIVLWNMFSQAHVQHFIAIVPYFGPFQGVMFCKNGPKILQIDISCMFFDLIMSESFFITLFYDIFLVQHIFIFFCHLSSGAGRGTIARRTCFSRNSNFMIYYCKLG